MALNVVVWTMLFLCLLVLVLLLRVPGSCVPSCAAPSGMQAVR